MFFIINVVEVAHVFSPKLVHMIRQSGTYFIEYENENELECIITEFTDVIIKEVLPLYDIIIRPDQYPTPELEKELYDNIELYAERFIQRYHMTYETKVGTIKKCVKELERLVDDHRYLTENDLNEFLLCVSGYYGELIRRAHKGGGWEELEESHLYSLKFVNESIDRSSLLATVHMSPLNAIFAYWDKPEIYRNRIIADYKHLLWGIGLEQMYE